MNREANTIGSKAMDAQIAYMVVDIKAGSRKNKRTNSEHRVAFYGQEELTMKLINIGFGNMVSANRLVAIVSPSLRRLSVLFKMQKSVVL